MSRNYTVLVVFILSAISNLKSQEIVVNNNELRKIFIQTNCVRAVNGDPRRVYQDIDGNNDGILSSSEVNAVSSLYLNFEDLEPNPLEVPPILRTVS